MYAQPVTLLITAVLAYTTNGVLLSYSHFSSASSQGHQPHILSHCHFHLTRTSDSEIHLRRARNISLVCTQVSSSAGLVSGLPRRSTTTMRVSVPGQSALCDSSRHPGRTPAALPIPSLAHAQLVNISFVEATTGPEIWPRESLSHCGLVSLELIMALPFACM